MEKNTFNQLFDRELSSQPEPVQSCWKLINTNSVEKPLYRTDIVDRLSSAYTTKSPLYIFTPWGMNPTAEFNQQEKSGLTLLSQWQRSFETNQIPTQVILMPADLYATEVNQSTTNYQSYLLRLTGEATALGFNVLPWSTIRQENISTYQKKKKYFRPELINRIFPQRTLLKAVETARNRSGETEDTQIRQSVLAYIQERLVEAEIIETIFKPIKISMVSPTKDIFDLNLPRIYVIPTQNRFPWLK